MAQRNFSAGLLGLSENVTPVSNAEAARLLAGLLDGTSAADRADVGAAAKADDGAPWHDPVMPLLDRMKLAEGKLLPRRLMAAMAQQDCGQCGYNCKDYADALFAKSEKRLNLCVPGGKETSRTLKQLYQEFDGAPRTAPAVVPATTEERTKPALARPPGRSRDNPVYATFLSRRRLNKIGSEKETWHIDIDLAGTDLDYVVGDSLAFFPPTIAILSPRYSQRSMRRPIFPSVTALSATCSRTASRCRRRRICYSSLFPI